MSNCPHHSNRARREVNREAFSKLNRAAILINEQVGRVLYASRMRAFRIWLTELPLNQKCDELARQLRERTFILDTVRNSYLKDVVSVKYHLDQLMKVQINDNAIELWQKNAYDLHVVPYVDLRELINKAKSSLQQSSAQILENLVDVGVIDPETCRTLNPWEQSRSYRRIERLRKGQSYQFAKGGESIHLAAPSNCKIFVKWCKDCIGKHITITSYHSVR
jgi:hypothetical protein